MHHDQIGFNKVAAFRLEDFSNFAILDSWVIDYVLAKTIAEKANQSFGGKLRELGQLQEISLAPGGEKFGLIQHSNPYWRFVADNSGKVNSIYIDAMNGDVILMKESYLK